MQISKLTLKVNNELGQTLIEVVVIATLVTIILVALVSAISRSIANNQTSNDQVSATTLAQEPIEWLRYWRSVLGWKGLIEILGIEDDQTLNLCIPSLPTNEEDFQSLKKSICGEGDSINELYQRNMQLKLIGNKMNFKIVVKWSGARGDKQVVIEQDIYDWK